MALQTNTAYKIINAKSGKSWAVSGNRASDENNIVQYDQNTSPNQLFMLTPGGGPNEYNIITHPEFGDFHITLLFDNTAAGRAAALANGFGNMFHFLESPLGNGTTLKISNDLTRQRTWFLFSNNGGNSYLIQAAGTNFVADVENDSNHNNANVIIFEPNNQNDQQWMFVSVEQTASE